jgi:cell division protein FtsI (penicillin-binding protein 3)
MLTVIKEFLISNFFSWSYSGRSRFFRLIFVSIFFFLGYLTIIIKLLSISATSKIDSSHNKMLSKNYRRDIVDRNGQILATNITLASLYANPKKIINPKYTVDRLKSVIPNLDYKKLLSELSQDKTFVWIKREITPKIQEELVSLGLPGLYFENEQKRIYTQGKATSHILGYVDRDNAGIAGIEKYFDKELIKGNSEEPLRLSVDYRVQNIVSDELDKVIEKFSAKGGVGIVADATNGEIVAMVSKPDFDPHSPSTASSEQLFNRASLGAYEIGSAIKTLTFAIAFDTNTIQMNDVYNLGNFNVGKFRVKDYHKHDGWNTVPQLFMNSSNIGSSMIALEVGKKDYRKYIEKFGLTKQVKIEIPERAYPIIPSDNRVSDLSLATMSYGYGFSISPLHFVQAMIPVVNGGYKYPVTLVKEDKDIEPEKIISEEASINVIKLMRLTVDKGTGRKAAVKGYLVAGKTGTANKLGPKGYLQNSRFSSFIAAVPSINPKFVVFVFLDDPKGIKETFGFATAGFTAAPTTGNIISRIGSLYGIEPYDEDSEEIKNLFHVDYEVDSEI